MSKRHVFSGIYVGKKITIIKGPSSSVIGLSGTIRDESQHTFVVETAKGSNRLAKKALVFECEGRRVDAAQLNRRPEERLKMKIHHD